MGHLNSTVFSSFRAVPLHYHTFVFYLSIVKERMRRLPTFWGFFFTVLLCGLRGRVSPFEKGGSFLFAHTVCFIKCQLTDVRKTRKKMSSSTTTTSKNTLRSRLPRFNFLKKAPKKVAESKLDKDLANFVEKVSQSNSRKNSSTTDAAACSVLSAKDKQNTNIKLR